MENTFFRHPLSDVQSSKIGANTKIWQFVVILPEAEIGEGCNINAQVFIENKVKIGNRCTIKCGVQLWDGITLGNDVFIGPNVTFTNDKYPQSGNSQFSLLTTKIGNGVSIGANATILPGLTIGDGAVIGAGSVVTQSVPAHQVWVGNPARFLKTTAYSNASSTSNHQY